MHDERLRQKKTLEKIADETKIPQATLRKIELDEFGSLPSATFTKGFLRNFAENLALDPVKILAVFRRDFIETKKGIILPKEMHQAVDKSGFGFNPRTLSILGFVFIIGLFLTYLALQLRTVFIPPRIVLEPIPQNVTEENIMIKGKINREAVVTVNNDLVLVEDNRFSYEVKLQPGKNKITVKAVDRRKKESKIEIEIDRN